MTDMFSEFDDAEDDNSDGTPNPDGPKALREAHKREKEKREELERQLAAIREEQRRAKLAESLNAAGVNPLVAELIPKDVKEDGVADWLAKYKDAFGPAQTEEQQEQQQTLSEEEQQQLASVSGAPEGTIAPVPDEYLANLSKAESKKDFYARVNAWASNPTGAPSP